jgi:hypothetical protein
MSERMVSARHPFGAVLGVDKTGAAAQSFAFDRKRFRTPVLQPSSFEAFQWRGAYRPINPSRAFSQ